MAQFCYTILFQNKNCFRRLEEAKSVLHDTLLKWRNNGFALVHYGFVLKNFDKNFEDAIIYLREGINSGDEGTQDGKFFFHLGDALTKLGRNDEAMEVTEYLLII